MSGWSSKAVMVVVFSSVKLIVLQMRSPAQDSVYQQVTIAPVAVVALVYVSFILPRPLESLGKQEEDWQNWSYPSFAIPEVFPLPNSRNAMTDPNSCSNLLSLACGLWHWAPQQSASSCWSSKVNTPDYPVSNDPERKEHWRLWPPHAIQTMNPTSGEWLN